MMDGDRFSEVNMTDEKSSKLLANADEQNPSTGETSYDSR